MKPPSDLMLADTRSAFEERVIALDAQPTAAELYGSIDTDVAHFIRTMSVVTAPGLSTLPPASPQLADEIMANSSLIKRLGERAPEIVSGPLRRKEQYWVATGRPPNVSPRAVPLARTHFVAPSATGDVPLSTKPFNVGLYTSTAVFGSFGMWWSYLEMHRGSTLFPHPWRVWAVRAAPDAKVLEIASASEWVDFVSADASSTDGLLYPDWNAVAGHWHAIHMTVAAIAATQGIRFSLGRRVVAPPYWDVESTLWLRWVFTEISDEDGYQPSREG